MIPKMRRLFGIVPYANESRCCYCVPLDGGWGMARTRQLFSAAAFAFALSATAAAATEFGAIAYSPATGAHGYSYNYSTRRQADRVAMANCRAYADDCRIIVDFWNACAALAVGSNYGYGFAYNVRRSAAQATALAICRRNDSGCKIVRWVCSK